jgi:hypothetical protein
MLQVSDPTFASGAPYHHHAEDKQKVNKNQEIQRKPASSTCPKQCDPKRELTMHERGIMPLYPIPKRPECILCATY